MTASTPNENIEPPTVAGDQPAGNDSSVIPDALLSRLRIKIPGYQLLRKIGDGGQAVVFLANQESTGRRVAVKLLREGPLADENARERHWREIRILAALNHPNIVGIIDSGETEDGHDYLVMDYIAGEPLDEFIRKTEESASPDPSALLRLFMKICDAVNVAHLRGITHRDLSPSNIRIDERGEPHVLDFGLARTAFDRFITQKNRDISVTGQFLGKLAYASPEQAMGNPDKIDIRTDVYALGVILYQILTGGKFPYEVVGNVADVLNNIIRSRPIPPSKLLEAKDAQDIEASRQIKKHHPPVVNEAIEAIVLKALEKTPENRYQSAGELSRQIENYLSGKPTAGINAPRNRPTSATPAQLAITVLLTALVMVAIWLCMQSGKQQAKSYQSDAEHRDVSIAPNENAKLKVSRLLPSTREFTNSIGMKFVRIDPGEFEMGLPGRKTHRVVNNPFFLSVTAVTQRQFVLRMSDASNRSAQKGSDLPVCCNWTEAHDFLLSLSRRDADGMEYSLPTEEQWEFAARFDKIDNPIHEGRYLLQPVSRLEPNRFGLCGMTGSIPQWCFDKYNNPEINDFVPTPTNLNQRVFKGGFGDSGTGIEFFQPYMHDGGPVDTGGVGFRACIQLDNN